jgi:hypothetical protein
MQAFQLYAYVLDVLQGIGPTLAIYLRVALQLAEQLVLPPMYRPKHARAL